MSARRAAFLAGALVAGGRAPPLLADAPDAGSDAATDAAPEASRASNALIDPWTGARAAPASVGLESGGVVNVNAATEAELQLLPGIGPARAAAIVAYRTRRPFVRPEDLLRVKGIGRATYGRLRAFMAMSGDTTLRARPRPARSPP